MRTLGLLFVVASLLGGCATTPNTRYFAGVGENGSADRVYDPVRWTGVLDSPARARGDVAAFVAMFPDVLGAELYLGRQSWSAWIVDGDGHETATDAVFAGCGSGGFQLLILVDGGLRGGERALVLSTRTERAFDLGGREVGGFDGNRFRMDPEYRRGLVSRSGTALSTLATDSAMPGIVAGWKRFGTPAGIIRSPLSQGTMQDIHAVNPRERLDEHMLDQSWTLSPGWESMLVQFGLETAGSVYDTFAGKCTGWHGACRKWTPTQTFSALKRACATGR